MNVLTDEQVKTALIKAFLWDSFMFQKKKEEEGKEGENESLMGGINMMED